MTAHTNVSDSQSERKMNKEFKRIFNTDPLGEYHAPARVNLIGEHIDYNGGHVLPCAISLYICASISFNDNHKINLYSENLDSKITTDINHTEYDKSYSWATYPIGVIDVLKSLGHKIDRGINIYYSSQIPLGSGLSSSAAILVLTAYMLNDIFKLNLSNLDIAKIAIKTEREYCGLSCGIMDQSAIALAEKDTCLYLDCNKFEYEYKNAVFDNVKILILNTKYQRKLTESKYNERVGECSKALSIIKSKYNVSNLCELKPEELDNIQSLLNDEALFKRVRHCITEEERVKSFMAALDNKDYVECGKILNESHKSLKEDYEVSGINLDVMTEIARNNPFVYGARMTGAGFGGCAVALVQEKHAEEVKEDILKQYKERFGYEGEAYLIDVTRGPAKI